MSKLFNDPIYKNMSESEDSWLELAIEPYHFRLNDLIAALPQKLDLDFKFFAQALTNRNHSLRWGVSINYSDVIHRAVLETHGKDIVDGLSSQELDQICASYKLSMPEGTVLNMVDKELSNPVSIVKTRDQIPDDQVIEVISNIAVGKIGIAWGARRSETNEILSRMNEILDLLEVSGAAKNTRSIRKKETALTERFREILVEDKWRIRSADIIINAGIWIHDWCTKGNRHALMNFTRLKCMTHKGKPIYSMEEIS